MVMIPVNFRLLRNDGQCDFRLKLVTVFIFALQAHVTCRQCCHTPLLGLTVYPIHTQIHMVDFCRDTVTSHTLNCCRTLLVQQRERLLASVAGGSVPSVLNVNCQRTFKKPLVISRRGCIQRTLNGKNGWQQITELGD